MILAILVAAAVQHCAFAGLRELIEARTVGKNYDHRLMDYNKDPRRTFADVTSAFREALKRMDDASWLAAHGFAPAS